MLGTKVKEAQAKFAAVRKLQEIEKLSDEVKVEAITFRGTGSMRKRKRFYNKNRKLAGSESSDRTGQESQIKGTVARERKVNSL